MYTCDQIQEELNRWKSAEERIRALEPVDFTTNFEGWQSHYQAIDDAETLAQVLARLSEAVAGQAQARRELLGRIEEQAHSEQERF